jgi:hypothetical protein
MVIFNQELSPLAKELAFYIVENTEKKDKGFDLSKIKQEFHEGVSKCELKKAIKELEEHNLVNVEETIGSLYVEPKEDKDLIEKTIRYYCKIDGDKLKEETNLPEVRINRAVESLISEGIVKELTKRINVEPYKFGIVKIKQ